MNPILKAAKVIAGGEWAGLLVPLGRAGVPRTTIDTIFATFEWVSDAWCHISLEEHRNLRVVALCFAAAMEKTGDL